MISGRARSATRSSTASSGLCSSLMCGIAGFLGRAAFAGRSVGGERMASAILQRGPDDHGVWCDATAGIVLAHRRLSVLDLSPAGHQPMTSQSGRYVIAYNGEIYNHLELRDSLQRPAPRHHGGDTPIPRPSWRCRGLGHRRNPAPHRDVRLRPLGFNQRHLYAWA